MSAVKASSQPARPGDECGFAHAIEVIKGKWKSTIIWELYTQPIRFGELRRRLGRISEKMLFAQLRQLEADGIVHRQAFDEATLRVEYSLTEAGAALNDAAHRLAEWGDRHRRHQHPAVVHVAIAARGG